MGLRLGVDATRVMKAWVYILRCADGSYYTGHTTNLEHRVAQHRAGLGSTWIRARLPVDLVFTEEMKDRYEAVLAERRIKTWTREQKKALIRRDSARLRLLLKKR